MSGIAVSNPAGNKAFRLLCLFCVVSLLASPIPVAARSESWVCGRLVNGIAGSNPAGSIDLCCQVKNSSSGLSLVWRSPTKCGVFNCSGRETL